MAETQFVEAVSKTTRQKQRAPAHFLELAAAGVEPFNDFALPPSGRDGDPTVKPAAGEEKKEAGDAQDAR